MAGQWRIVEYQKIKQMVECKFFKEKSRVGADHSIETIPDQIDEICQQHKFQNFSDLLLLSPSLLNVRVKVSRL